MRARWAVTTADGFEAVIPDFEPYRLGRVTSVYFDFGEAEDDPSVFTARFRVEYWTQSPQELLVELILRGVRQMVLPELGSSIFEFGELEVTDVSDRGLEGIRREVFDHGGAHKFKALCQEVAVSGVFVRDGSSISRIWPTNPGS
jgi:hypothetical protein